MKNILEQKSNGYLNNLTAGYYLKAHADGL
jgi:hypothetical protein